MNAMQSFLRKYHAVPANDTGPQWSQATDEALLGWFDANKHIARSGLRKAGDGQYEPVSPQERAAVLPIYQEIVAELDRRRQLPGCSPEIYAAWVVTRL